MSHILNWNVNLQLRMSVCDGQFHSWLLWPATSKIPPQNIIGKQFLRKRTVAKDCPLQNTKTTNLSVLMGRNTELNNAQDRETIKKWIYQTHRREIFPLSDFTVSRCQRYCRYCTWNKMSEKGNCLQNFPQSTLPLDFNSAPDDQDFDLDLLVHDSSSTAWSQRLWTNNKAEQIKRFVMSW